MSEQHPDLRCLERFLEDDLPEEQSRALQRHLFTCPACEERMIGLLPGPKDSELEAWSRGGLELAEEEPGSEPEYRGLIHKVLHDMRSEMARRESRMSRERAEAAELWRELAGQSAERRRLTVASNPRRQSWGLFELLLDEARARFFGRPQEAAELLRLALDVARRLDPQRYGPGSVEAAQARAWAYLGNVLRILSDFRAADQAFQGAERHLAQSWLDPLDEALILELKASLRRAQGRFGEAREMLDGAIALYREVNEPHLQGRSLITKGLVLQYANDPAAAAECFRNGLFLIDPAEEPRLVIVAHHGLIHCLNDRGRFAEAAALIAEARPIWQDSGRHLDMVRLRWLEGKVANGLGRDAEAERAFLEVREAFVAEGIAYDAALVSLDLAALYVRQRRAAEARGLAAEIEPVFRARDVHREAMAALIVFKRAAELEQLTLSLIDEVSRYLESARGNPGLRFRGGEPGCLDPAPVS